MLYNYCLYHLIGEKNFSIDFMTGFLISTNWKSDNYNLILVIINQLIKIVYYEPVKITINALDLVIVIINVIIYHNRVLKLIVTN